MATVDIKCGIEGCDMSWTVASPKEMKSSMAEHRQKFHHEAQSKPKGQKPLRSSPGLLDSVSKAAAEPVAVPAAEPASQDE